MEIVITKDMMLAARDYVLNEQKEAWVAENAPKCFDRLAITADDEAMPPMFMVNAGLKARYLMGAFASLYMGVAFEADEKDAFLMSEAAYDKWAGSHVFGQIDRLKHDVALRDKCYDLMADFRDLEKRFSAQLNALLTVQNDPVIRQSQFMTAQVKELPALLEQLKAFQEGRDDGKSTAADQ